MRPPRNPRSQGPIAPEEAKPRKTTAEPPPAPSARRQRLRPATGPVPPPVLKTAALTPIFQDDFNVANLDDPNCPWQTGYPWGQTISNLREYNTRYDKNFLTQCNPGDKNHIYTGTSLRLEVRHEPGLYEIWKWDQNGNFIVPSPCESFDFTSGMLYSKQKFLYGYFEIECSLPLSGTKLYPAFWLWDAPPYREIDIFEFTSPDVPNLQLTNIHIARELDFGRYHPSPGQTEAINDYPGVHTLADVAGFHRYGVDWRPNCVTWLVDGVPIRTLAGRSPHLEMNLIINLGVDGYYPPLDTSLLPKSMEINHVRVYRSSDPEFLYHWGNQGSGQIAVWNMHPSDRFIVGDFFGTGGSQLLALAAQDWAHLMRWDGADWQYAWGNQGSNKIAVWQMRPDDRYVVGDFDGDGRDELLVIAASNGWSHLMRWNGSDWDYVWGNQGAGQIAVWNINPSDRFVAGDFDGDGKAELLAIAAQGWSHLMRWDGSNWQYVWGNNGDGKIAVWNIHPPHRFLAGDFDGDGRVELLAMAESDWSHLMRWDGSAWHYVWGNNGDSCIGLWQMSPGDRFAIGDFEGAGRSQLACFSPSGWSHLVEWNGSDWRYVWGNAGGETIHRWFMKPTDRFVSGAFAGGKSLLLAASENSWSHLLKFEPVP